MEEQSLKYAAIYKHLYLCVCYIIYMWGFFENKADLTRDINASNGQAYYHYSYEIRYNARILEIN